MYYNKLFFLIHRFKIQRNAQFQCAVRTLDDAGVAVPAFFRIERLGNFALHAAEEHAGLAGFNAAETLLARAFMNEWRHDELLLRKWENCSADKIRKNVL